MKKLTIFISMMFVGSIVGLATAYSAEREIKKTEDFVPHELVVKFKNPNIKSALVRYSAGEKKTFRASGAKLLRFPSVVDLETTMAELRRNPNVEYVELNAIYKLQLLATPDDEDYSRLYGMDSMAMPEAWEENVGSRDILVGVIDTGMDYNHPDLVDNAWTNTGETGLDADGNDKSTNGIDDDENGYVDDFRGWDFINGDNDPMDGHGHGTHCAGTIGATGNNGIGVAGVNWEVSLVGLKIFSDAGSTTLEAITEAIEYSTLIGVNVTNNSWGGGNPSDTIKAAIQEASDAQILFIAAAGNSSANNDTGSFYPANYDIPNLISVAAVDSSDRLANFSNYGKAKVHVAAPGVNIYSTKPGGGYQNMSGTSMAAPHITGLAAFIMAKYPGESMARVKRRIVYTGDSVGAISDKVISGKRANGLSSMQEDQIAPSSIEGFEIVEALMSSVEFSFKASGDDGLEGEASEYEVKISETPITADNWDEAELLSSGSLPSVDGVITLKLENLGLNSTGYVAVRAADDIGNLSPISDSLEYATLVVEILEENNAETLDGATAEGTWGLEVDEDGNSMFSDSPEGKYGNNVEASLTIAPMTATGEKTFLRLQTEYDLETRYDYGYVEISADGSEWVEVAKFNGKSNGFVNPIINITDVVSGAESYQIRFRITTDSSAIKEGWKIDSVTILGNL